MCLFLKVGEIILFIYKGKFFLQWRIFYVILQDTMNSTIMKTLRLTSLLLLGNSQRMAYVFG